MRRSGHVVLQMSMVAVAIAVATAVDTPAFDADLRADMVRALGGAEALGGIRDAVLSSSITLSGGQGDHRGDVVTEIVYPDKIRVTLALGSGRMTQGFDGVTPWLRAGPQAVELPPSMADEMRRLVWLTGGIGLVQALAEGRADVHAVEKTTLDGEAMTVADWTLETERLRLWVDATTHLVRKVAYQAYSQQGLADVEVVWSDYRDGRGVKVPWTAVTFRNRLRYSDATLKEIRFNAAPDPAGFSRDSR